LTPARNQGRVDGMELLGVAEIAALLGVKAQTVSVWRIRAGFPPPDLTVASAALWRQATVERWARETGRMRSDDGRGNHAGGADVA